MDAMKFIYFQSVFFFSFHKFDKFKSSIILIPIFIVIISTNSRENALD